MYCLFLNNIREYEVNSLCNRDETVVRQDFAIMSPRILLTAGVPQHFRRRSYPSVLVGPICFVMYDILLSRRLNQTIL